MFRVLKNLFNVLLTGKVSTFNHIKCISLSNQKFTTQPNLVNLHPNECNQKFHYYSFVVKLFRYVGGCNNFNDLSYKVCVANKTDDLYISVFNMITETSKS